MCLSGKERVSPQPELPWTPAPAPRPHVTGFRRARSAGGILMARPPEQLQLPGQELQTRASGRTRGSAPLHTALQAGGKGTNKPPAIALSGGPHHVLPTGPREHGLSFAAATPSPPPWGSFEPQAGFRAGRRIPWLPSSHPLCPWLALKPFYCSKCQLGNKQGSNKITDEKADLRFYLIFKKLHF